ncbi:hypothetical protein BT63DRAFT_457103 [Microthyrium microscopicum]|uniref:Heterokaryon incompatibility domain-containing protein n=1 Tax=Microthyrium microscopicum TaxID=703497 RepID=A0A6A6UA76_9PEZI|nr:hypothetical protein BT63DRAFT_457103 [Microthyrium microscopicum]
MAGRLNKISFGMCPCNTCEAQKSGLFPPLLMDVRIREVIVPENEPVKYIALSYVWGTTPMSKTLKASIQAHKAFGANTAGSLSAVIGDAMAVVAEMGRLTFGSTPYASF